MRSSTEGLQYWASLYTETPEARPKPTCDGTNGGGVPPPRKRGSLPPAQPKEADQQAGPAPVEGEDPPTKKSRKAGDGTSAKKEREVKELLAQEQASDNSMTVIAAGMTQDPSWWSWAKDVVATYRVHRTNVVTLYADNVFFQKMKVAALSPKELAKVKKDFRDDYVAKLCEFVTKLGPCIQKMAETSFQVENMAKAKRAASEEVQSQKNSKPKPKRKAAPKRRSSSSSLTAAA